MRAFSYDPAGIIGQQCESIIPSSLKMFEGLHRDYVMRENAWNCVMDTYE